MWTWVINTTPWRLKQWKLLRSSSRHHPRVLWLWSAVWSPTRCRYIYYRHSSTVLWLRDAIKINVVIIIFLWCLAELSKSLCSAVNVFVFRTVYYLLAWLGYLFKMPEVTLLKVRPLRCAVLWDVFVSSWVVNFQFYFKVITPGEFWIRLKVDDNGIATLQKVSELEQRLNDLALSVPGRLARPAAGQVREIALSCYSLCFIVVVDRWHGSVIWRSTAFAIYFFRTSDISCYVLFLLWIVRISWSTGIHFVVPFWIHQKHACNM